MSRPTQYELKTHKWRKYSESKDPSYCGSCNIDTHCAQMRDKNSWVQSGVKMWEKDWEEKELKEAVANVKSLKIPSTVNGCQLMILALVKQNQEKNAINKLLEDQVKLFSVEAKCNHCHQYHGKEPCDDLVNENCKLKAEIQLVEKNTDRQSDLLRNVRDSAKAVLATSRNTKSVREGHELSGYTKYYTLPTYVVTAVKNHTLGQGKSSGEEIEHLINLLGKSEAYNEHLKSVRGELEVRNKDMANHWEERTRLLRSQLDKLVKLAGTSQLLTPPTVILKTGIPEPAYGGFAQGGCTWPVGDCQCQEGDQ